MADEPVLFETRGNIAVISINRAQRRNAIDGLTTRCLRAAINRFEGDGGLVVGIIRGEGPVFCSGMDLLAFGRGEAEEILFGEGGLGGLVSRVRQKPLVAAVHGAAVAGGFELMLACDLVVAADTCRFGLPEAKRGLVAGAGGALRLAERLSPALANEILLTGDLFGTARAYEMGLVNRVVPEPGLLESALSLAATIAANAPLSLRASLALSKAAGEVAREGLWPLNDRLLRGLIASADAVEGAAAFTERRRPVWQGE